MAATRSGASVFTGRTAQAVRRTVTTVVFVVAALSFAFGFGNGWALGVQLGVPGWIAPLVAPAVDLSVVALLATIQFLRAHGLGGRLAGPRLLLGICGLITFALNTARPILAGQAGRACFDAVAPVLLVGWSEVGPRLLGLLHSTVPGTATASRTVRSVRQVVPVPTAPSPDVPRQSVTVLRDRPTVPDHPGRPGPPTGTHTVPGTEVAPGGVGAYPAGIVRHSEDDPTASDPNFPASTPSQMADLLAAARRVEAAHLAAHKRRISRDALRKELRVSNAVAGAVLRQLRAESATPDQRNG